MSKSKVKTNKARKTIIASAIFAFTAAAPAFGADTTRARTTTTPTAQEQSNDKADIELTAKIRREVMAKSDFSTSAKNVKIISNAGHVTLVGPVSTTQEKQEIERIANGIAGATKVRSQIEVVH